MSLPPPNSPAFLDLPALAPPPGVTPNLINPSNLAAPELAVLQLCLATLVISMRLYTKIFIVRKMMVEDWLLSLAYVFFASFHVLVFQTEALPLGVHQWDTTIRGAMDQARLFLITTSLYALVALPLKVALILQIKRIVLPLPSPTHSTFHLSLRHPSKTLYLRLTIYFFIALNVVFYITMFIFPWLQCRPLAKAWDPRVSGKCVPHHLLIHAFSAGINTASDVITIVLPMPVLWGLKMERRKRIGLCAVFGVGILACIASSFRLFFAIRLQRTSDLTFVGAQLGKFIEPEFTLGFLAACLPVLPTFIKHVAPGVKRLCKRNSPSKTVSMTQVSFGLGGGGSKGVREGQIRKVVETDIWVGCAGDEELGVESDKRGSVVARQSGFGRREEWNSEGVLGRVDEAHLPQWI